MNTLVAFNGGKESIVVLDLLLNTIKIQPQNIILMYVQHEDEFEEMSEFVDYIVKSKNIKIHYFNDLKEGMKEMIELYGCNHFFCGMRKDDFDEPKEFSLIQKCDEGYPEAYMCNIILEWNYNDVWDYILKNKLEYCSLYDQGYTSLGIKSKTFKNYYLFDGEKFKNAYELKDISQERSGRIKNKLPNNIEGIVARGKQNGKKIGYPTANINVSLCLDIDDGVYSGITTLPSHKKYKSVISVGYSLDNTIKTIETHLLDYEGDDFYDTIIKIELISFIRKMVKVSNLEKLKEMIKKDIKVCKLI